MGVTHGPIFENEYSMSFDGADDYVDIGLVTALNGASTFTISMWVNADSFPASDNVCFAVVTDANNRIWMDFSSSGDLIIGVGNGSNAYENLATGFSTSTWYHLAVVFDGGETGVDRVTLYVDGVAKTTTHLNFPATTATFTTSTFIGSYDSGLYPFNGKIDEVAIWNIALSSSQVSAIYSNGRPSRLEFLPDPPAIWYRMGDNATFKDPQWLIPNNENKDNASNYSFEFDGVNDYINLGTNTYIDSAAAFSVSCWVKITDFSPNLYPTLMQLKTDTTYGWIMAVSNHSNYLGVIIGSGNSSNLDWIRVKTSTAASVFTGNWVHIVATYNGNGKDAIGNFAIYVNGASATLSTAYDFALNNQVNQLGVAAGAGSLNLLEGNMDGVAIFDTELTSGNVTSIFADGVPNDVTDLGISGLVGWWKLGDNATYKYPQWLIPNNENKDKASNYSLDFNGTTQYVDCGDITAFNGATEMSCFAWIKINTLAANKGIMAKWDYQTQGCFAMQLSGIAGGADELQVFIADSITDAGQRHAATTDANLVAGTWYYVGFVYDGSLGNTDRVKIYVDGVVQTTTTTYTIPTSLTTATSSFKIGKFGGTLPRNIDANIDEVSIFSSALSAVEVSGYYNFGIPTDLSEETGLVGYWKLGEMAYSGGTGDIWAIPDSSTNNNTGLAQNMTLDTRVGDAPGSTNNALSSNMTIEDRVGDAPGSTNNALSYNMELNNRVNDTP